MQAGRGQPFLIVHEPYLFARFHGIKLVIMREFHPLYDSDPESFGFHELPPSCIGGVTV
jgi:hypothetical protein